MKTQLFAAAAVLAVAVSAPAFAQNVGSIGAAVNYTDVKATGIDARRHLGQGRRQRRHPDRPGP